MEVLLIRLAIGLVALYGAAVGYLKARETSIVYAGRGRTFRELPARETGVPWDTITVRAADSVPVLLLTTRVDTASQRPWVLYFHGNLGLLGARGNVGRYQLLREAGFNVLAVEYRGFGLSYDAGKPSEKGVYGDASAAWVHLTETLGVSPNRIALYGLSLGAGPATYLAERYEVGALITEGTPTSLPDVGAKRYPWVPVRLIMRNRFPNLKRAPAIAERWTLFHGRRDITVPFSHSEKIASAAPNAELVSLASDHNGGVVTDRATSLERLRAIARSLEAQMP